MKMLTPLILALLLVSCSTSTPDPRISYYQGIQDYCEHVTIVNAQTGESFNRTHDYCVNLVNDLREKKFYEKYHPSY